MFSLLPTSLLALLFAAPSLTAPTTPNDPFHDIAVHVLKLPEEPVCCLRPLAPLEPASEEDILLSFEDWKAKQHAETREHDPPAARPPHVSENLSETIVVSDSSNTPSQQPPGSVAVDVQDNGSTQERLAPHFRIPLTDRFNYASLDCSARVHAAHKTAKSASSILSSKKDRYMLSPCDEEKQFVVVELCEDIRIDTVQLANYEFFSGVFKEFSVSVAKTYTTKPEEWTFAGSYRAKNVRGVQSFHPPPTLRDFYRYIRIDFHSHYGSEYYCPVSLLRVYGLTHLEEWQWETWEAESRARRSVEEASPPVEILVELPSPAHIPDADEQLSTSGDASSHSIPVTSEILDSLQYNVSTSPPGSQAEDTTSDTHSDTEGATPKTSSEDIPHDSARSHSDTLYNTPVSLSPLSSHTHSTVSDNHSSVSSIFISSDASSSHTHTSSSIRASPATPNVSSLATLSPSYAPPVPPISSGGESIYRTIMNRLTALEGNTNLYARYVEEQTAGMREVLRRLTEDIGRLEGIGKAQAQIYQRSVVELEKQTRRLENEQRELMYRVNLLTDEVVLEKRLGIAQLCLLLTVLVFMALTRGSRGEHALPPGSRGSVSDWGRRTLSFSGELVNRLRVRSSTPPRVTVQKKPENDIAFPSIMMTQTSDERPRIRRSHAVNNPRRAHTRPHTPTAVRTPTGRHFVGFHRLGGIPVSPLGPRPAIQRSNSSSHTIGFGGIGPVPKSAKRWARSAHLHEVKQASTPRRPGQGDEENMMPSTSAVPALTTRDVFDGSVRVDDSGAQVLIIPPAMSRSETVTLGKGKGRMVAGGMRQPSPLRPAAVIDLSSPPVYERKLAHSEGDMSEGDAWVDTDVGSECDSVVDVGPEGTRERTYTAPAASNRSL